MFKRLARRKQEQLEIKLAETDAKLAMMKVELAAKMVQLSRQTEDLAPLAQAEDALRAAQAHYSFEDTPAEISMVQEVLGDQLVKLGREASDKPAIMRGREAYRIAITLASLHGDEYRRTALRDKVKIADSLLGNRPKFPSLFRVA